MKNSNYSHPRYKCEVCEEEVPECIIILVQETIPVCDTCYSNLSESELYEELGLPVPEIALLTYCCNAPNERCTQPPDKMCTKCHHYYRSLHEPN